MCGMMRMKLVVMLSLVLAIGVVWAAIETVDGMTYSYTVSGGEATITKATGDNKTVVIPATLGGVPVRTLAGGAFMNNMTVVKVTIPKSIMTLTCVGYDGPFDGCVALVSCELPSGLKALPYACFSECTMLRHVDMPEDLVEIGGNAFYNCKSLTAIELPERLEKIGNYAFGRCSGLLTIDVPDGVTDIGSQIFDSCTSLTIAHIPNNMKSIPTYLFYCCSALKDVNIPVGVTSVGRAAFYGCRSLCPITFSSCLEAVGENAFVSVPHINFKCKPPTGLMSAAIFGSVTYPKEYGAQYQTFFSVSQFGGYENPTNPSVTIFSGVRQNDPTILDVVYQVTSTRPTVKVRALAFEDGERSFAKVVRPETFVADTNGVETAGNIGDAIVPNVPHTISWRVSSDWSNRLAKVSFEVLATEGELLPFEVRTIPASDAYGKMDVSWNAISESQWFDALLWLYADKCEKMSVRDGVCFYDGKMTASGTTLNYNKTASSYYSRTYNSETKQYDYVRYINTPEAVLDAMGYNVLSGDVLNYVNDETRLGLSPSGYRQYGWKLVGEQ